MNPEEKRTETEPNPENENPVEEDCAKETGETAEATETNEEAKEAPNPLLEAAKAKAAEYLAMAQRVQADFENYRKRNETVRADAYSEGRKDVAAVMLPVLDNL